MHGLLDSELVEFLGGKKEELDILVYEVERAIYQPCSKKEVFGILMEHYERYGELLIEKVYRNSLCTPTSGVKREIYYFGIKG